MFSDAQTRDILSRLMISAEGRFLKPYKERGNILPYRRFSITEQAIWNLTLREGDTDIEARDMLSQFWYEAHECKRFWSNPRSDVHYVTYQGISSTESVGINKSGGTHYVTTFTVNNQVIDELTVAKYMVVEGPFCLDMLEKLVLEYRREDPIVYFKQSLTESLGIIPTLSHPKCDEFKRKISSIIRALE